jgi:cytochrome c
MHISRVGHRNKKRCATFLECAHLASEAFMYRSALTTLSCTALLCAALGAQTTVAAEAGQTKFNNRCRTCHSVREGDNRLGPSLHAIFGKKAGSSEGYANYSQALRSSGVVWNEETLDKFIENPDALIPGNNMKPFPGVTDAEERNEIVGYLKASAE